MSLAAYWPALAGWATTQTQVILVLALLSLALVMVCVVALLHTRKQQ